jgi:hypothetical protein
MRKILGMIALGALYTSASFSQAKTAAISNPGGFYLKGGVNYATFSKSDENTRIDDANRVTSFHAGVMGDVPLGTNFSLQPGLFFTGKGSKTEKGDPNSLNYWKATSNPMYIEVPVNLVAKIHMDQYSRIYFGAGGYAAAGIAGKNKVESKIFGLQSNSERDIVFSNDNPFTSRQEDFGYGKIKRIDYGLNGVAGIEFNKFSFGANYGYGLAKINANERDNANDNGKHRVLSFSLAVKL